jgi:carboxyl-terminal processing protease
MTRRFLLSLLSWGLLVSTLTVPASAAPQDESEYYDLFSTLVDTIDQVDRNYVKDLDRRELLEAAIRGVLSKLDPYSNYIGPDEMNRFKTTVESQFGGIGIQITIDEGQLKVLSPLVGTPAYRAGIRAGDRILEIEGESTEGIDLEGAVSRLKGNAGTSVNLTVAHPGSNDPHEVTVAREVIHVQTVLGDRRNEEDDWIYNLPDHERIGYIRITGFSRQTPDELREAMRSLEKQGFDGLILDLRFNPGGLLSAAVEISDMFIPEGRIVSTEGRNSPKRVWDAHREDTYSDFPMAVLVNRYSASASEIVSACLQDHDRAIVIGHRTWGKGSVQNVIELEGGKSALKLTTAGYLRPNGKNIHRFPDAKEEDEWGVSPNDGFEVKLNGLEMAQLLEYRRMRDIVAFHEKSVALPENAESAEDKPADDKPAEPESTDDKPADKSDAVPPGDDPSSEDAKPEEDPASDESDSGKSEKGDLRAGTLKEKQPEDATTDDAGETPPPTPTIKPIVKEADEEAKEDAEDPFVDRQLVRAIEYLIAKIEAAKKPATEEPAAQPAAEESPAPEEAKTDAS